MKKATGNCPMCKGTGELPSGKSCPMCGGTGYV